MVGVLKKLKTSLIRKNFSVRNGASAKGRRFLGALEVVLESPSTHWLNADSGMMILILIESRLGPRNWINLKQATLPGLAKRFPRPTMYNMLRNENYF